MIIIIIIYKSLSREDQSLRETDFPITNNFIQYNIIMQHPIPNGAADLTVQ